MSERDGFLSHESIKQKLVMNHSSGYELHPTAYVTGQGRQFLEDYDRTKTQSIQTFNIESVSNSAIGNYNTLNNYSETPIKDLEELVSSLSDDEETKKQGLELVETLKKEDVKPGYLSRFEDFLQKYPKSVELISSFLTSMALASMK